MKRRRNHFRRILAFVGCCFRRQADQENVVTYAKCLLRVIRKLQGTNYLLSRSLSVTYPLNAAFKTVTLRKVYETIFNS